MQTFFVTYNTGEYDSYYEHVYSIDAESKEALYVEIHEAFDAFVDYQKKYREELEKVKEYRSTSKTAGEKQYKKFHGMLKDFFEKYKFTNDFVVYGYEIPSFDETMTSNKDDAFEKSSLEIHSVEEYIEFVRPKKRM